MSQETLQAILGRCVMDDVYRTLLFTHPDEALAGYELTKEERAALLAVDAETLEAFAERVGVHLARGERQGKAAGKPPVS